MYVTDRIAYAYANQRRRAPSRENARNPKPAIQSGAENGFIIMICWRKNPRGVGTTFCAAAALRSPSSCGQPWAACHQRLGATSTDASASASQKPGRRKALRCGVRAIAAQELADRKSTRLNYRHTA